MRILLYDTTAYEPASPLFVEALERLASGHGWDYLFFDESEYTRPLQSSKTHRALYKMLGGHPLSYWKLNRDFKRIAFDFRPDIVIVCKGTYLAPETLDAIRKESMAVLVNYATDDPWNSKACPHDLRRAIRHYDLYACTKQAIIPDVRTAGAREVIFVPFGYKPEVHFPESPQNDKERAAYTADVVFIGGCDQDRIEYFVGLTRAIPGIRLHLYGGYWQHDRRLRKYWKGFAYGREYRLAIGNAKIAINLVRRANRDGHVMRSFEIPACRGFMLAERTAEHLELFEEDKECAYFSSPEELIAKVSFYLRHDTKRQEIAQAGFEKVTQGGHRYEDRLVTILEAAKALRSTGNTM